MSNNLKKLQDKINMQFFDTAMLNNKQPFYFFIGTHPHLYDGIDIDNGTIYMLNNYFYEWLVNPLHFEHRYTTILNKTMGKYNNIKDIEMSHQILSIITNKSQKQYLQNIIDDTRSAQQSIMKQRNKNESGATGKTENKTTTTDGSTTTRNTDTDTTTSSDAKTANKELPMETTGSSFEGVVSWNRGASNISETKTEGTGTEDTQETITNNANGTNNTTIDTTNNTTMLDKIKREDASELAELARKLNNSQESQEEIRGQAVLLIKNIVSYLYQPKAIDFLIDELKSAFYRVY